MIPLISPSEFNSSEIPADPGVYLFKDEKGDVLYIGKAKSLRSRVRSYFSNSDQPTKTKQLVARIRSIDWIVVNNEVEALLLENKLVKQHTPRYNVNLKDAKTFAYIALTRETFPRILTSRKVSRKLESFGPYTDGFTRQDLQRLVVRIFKLRVCKKLPKRACLNFHIGLCTAPCSGRVTAEQYAEQVEFAGHFLNGNYEQTMQMLLLQMNLASKEQKYERALELRNQIASIRLLTERQIVDNERYFDQDVMAFKRFGEKELAVHMGIRKGVLLGKKEFSLDFQPQIEQDFLKAFYSCSQIPREILLNLPCWTDNSEKAALEEFLSHRRGGRVTLCVPRRGDRFALVKLAEKNIESAIDEEGPLADLQTTLNLAALPSVMECFDISNLGREHVVAGMVRFVDGKPDKSNYRRFRIKTVPGQDDFASINEAVIRRYRRLLEEKASMPDLIVVDGGLGQVSAAKLALQMLGLQLPLIGLAKEHEEIHLPGDSMPRQFDTSSRMMLLLRQIRDAAHNYALSYNKKRREMKIEKEFQTKRNIET